jgi:helix-turn-helix protein
VDYDVAAQIFLGDAPAAAPVPRPVVEGRAARRLRDAIEPIAMHAVWSRRTNESLADLGLNFLTAYVFGRAAALGEPEAAVVCSSFAVFDPAFLTPLYEEARGACTRDKLLSVRRQATVSSLAEVLGDADVAPAVSVLRRGIAAAQEAGRPLFSGLASQPWPSEPVGQLWRACDLLREHRGDGHIAVFVAAGLGPVEMNILTELWLGMPLLSYTATRGWDQESIDRAVLWLSARGLFAEGSLTDAGRRLRDSIEKRTDDLEQPIVDAIGDDLDIVLAHLNRWSEVCIAARSFPADPAKRAAG